jgi:hypothetical protein
MCGRRLPGILQSAFPSPARPSLLCCNVMLLLLQRQQSVRETRMFRDSESNENKIGRYFDHQVN